jgi:anhydro-N-acetylmuramic acid kinase
MDKITAIGIMSGTSVDGLDVVAAEFGQKENHWTYRMIRSRAFRYPADLRKRLIECIGYTAEELIFLDHELGEFIGEHARLFCDEEGILPDLIASHGHTVFHQPERRITCQIGDGQTIHQITNIRVINDFRKIDVLRRGQGAPLVPVGDKFLFGNYEFCLNIGGFSNVSFDNAMKDRLAYDIGPANIILNYLARMESREFDDRGSIARSGKLINGLFDELNNLPYYSMNAPKSLGLEWVQKNIFSRIQPGQYLLPDLMRTFAEHVAFQINAAIKREKNLNFRDRNCNVLVTGGGAYNDFLMERLRDQAEGFGYVLPEREIIEFKEALIFAFLGVLRLKGLINVWQSVTGAFQDSSAGTIHMHH